MSRVTLAMGVGSSAHVGSLEGLCPLRPGCAGCGQRAGAGEGTMRPVAEQAGPGFGGLLRQLRADAGLTQEELAAAADLSPRSVSDLERGINRTARKETAVLLARALGLPGAVAELFVAAARGRGLAEDVVAARQGTALGAFAAAATRGLPRDVASFTGRRAELDRLAEGLDGLAAGGGVVGICAIGGMAGVEIGRAHV